MCIVLEGWSNGGRVRDGSMGVYIHGIKEEKKGGKVIVLVIQKGQRWGLFLAVPTAVCRRRRIRPIGRMRN